MARFAFPEIHRDIFCNRTLNLRSMGAIGYDMDYTLIHYREEEWERTAYGHLKQKLLAQGVPVGHLAFDPLMVHRGLVIDTAKGNILKTNRFGYVKKAHHGTIPMDYKAQSQEYSRTIIALSEERYVFLNTLFSLSEGCMYAQLVELLDDHKLPAVMGYPDLYGLVRESLNAAHMEGQLKAEIMADPDRFVLLDQDIPMALLDQRKAGKKIILITNSEWAYTDAMMRYAFDRYLSGGSWRDLFDIVIISARKPEFFTSQGPLFEVVEGSGLLKPTIEGLQPGKVYYGGNAKLVEKCLKMSGDEILYVGDHVFTDVHVSKSILRWRTALVLRELEDEIRQTAAFRGDNARLGLLMKQKRELEFDHCQLKLQKLRRNRGYGDQPTEPLLEIEEAGRETYARMQDLDKQIVPLVEASAKVGHPIWGLMMQAGNDKSLFARQVENYADIYTSRVSNFLLQSPFAYLRSPRGFLPHDVHGEEDGHFPT